MSAQPESPSPRPLLDPEQMEQAGRALRQLLDKLRLPPLRNEPDTSIAWEDGEPEQESRRA